MRLRNTCYHVFLEGLIRISGERFVYREDYSLDEIVLNLTVPVIGCVVNGPGEARETDIKALENSRIWYPHYALAGALGLKGDIEGAKAAIADLHKVKPEINSIANSYVYAPFLAYPSYRALIDKTINEDLRRVGFPET